MKEKDERDREKGNVFLSLKFGNPNPLPNFID
jgi:hypothetical protein